MRTKGQGHSDLSKQAFSTYNSSLYLRNSFKFCTQRLTHLRGQRSGEPVKQTDPAPVGRGRKPPGGSSGVKPHLNNEPYWAMILSPALWSHSSPLKSCLQYYLHVKVCIRQLHKTPGTSIIEWDTAYTGITMDVMCLCASVGIVMGKHNAEMNLTDDTATYSLCFPPGILIATQFPAH